MSDQERFDRMANQISELHAFVFGVDGQGGLHRQVQDLETEVADLRRSRAAALGTIAGISSIATLVGSKFIGLLAGK